MRVFEAFAGMGAWGKALTRLGIPHEVVGFSEIDNYAIKAYCTLHGISPSLNYGDIRGIEKPPQIDLLCASPPCQSWSAGGRQDGADDDRGKLFYDTLRLAHLTQPKYICIENVRGLTFKKFEADLTYILTYLECLGYNVYHKVLCAADFGVPQMRQRLFIICIRKDCDDALFSFPEPYPLTVKLSDLLEPEVDEKYYEPSCRRVEWKENPSGGFPKLSCLGYFDGRNSQSSRIYADHTACTMTALGGGGGVKTGFYAVACNRKDRSGKLFPNRRIRRLTPLEVFRVMDFDDEDCFKLREIGISDARLYRLGGNSIVVNVVYEIFKKLFGKESQNENNSENQQNV